MADHGAWRKNIPEDFDGRFGKRFDDEIAPAEIIKVSVGLLIVTFVALVVCIVMMRYMEASAMENLSKSPSPIAAANERQIPSGPLLQASPEEELKEMRREMEARLGSYGWADEGRGLVHIPIAKAIELVAAGMMMPQAVGAQDLHGEVSAGAEDESLSTENENANGEASGE